jgi:hypothetical protein
MKQATKRERRARHRIRRQYRAMQAELTLRAIAREPGRPAAQIYWSSSTLMQWFDGNAWVHTIFSGSIPAVHAYTASLPLAGSTTTT